MNALKRKQMSQHRCFQITNDLNKLHCICISFCWLINEIAWINGIQPVNFFPVVYVSYCKCSSFPFETNEPARHEILIERQIVNFQTVNIRELNHWLNVVSIPD